MVEIGFEWYRSYAARYSEVSNQYLQSEYHDSSDNRLTHDRDVLRRTQELAPGRHGLDVGCGPGARDVAAFVAAGYDMIGVDAVAEGLELAVALHPTLAGRLICHDLRDGIPFGDSEFDFVTCNSVIQHFERQEVFDTVLPEIVRVVKPGGICLLHFKYGSGIWTVLDPEYDTERHFRLYDPDEVVEFFRSYGFGVVPSAGGRLGGVIRARDTKNCPECIVWFQS
ncbi:class I SAM-dependent methyltransferase [Paractinoplanes hotanensis]|uniref:Class I SAM-dependent methyltransferase n=1 Tax=Paractinoplanes hotanensis TaxID=2906497 RepID=A0ABT0XY50_9ACTN|nr:class I SAM-dependent methyltransferase [Actinoplanes hotanensis]MCM4078715.1 class I SAM-dependent methyltransferase [Actinoplanes hotanensis]